MFSDTRSRDGGGSGYGWGLDRGIERSVFLHLDEQLGAGAVFSVVRVGDEQWRSG